MLRNHVRLFAVAAALFSVVAIRPIRAQDQDDQKRGVARISLMNGEVSVRRGDSGEWVAGVINAPLLTDDRISTGPNSRAEIQFDASNILRIGGNAEVRLADLEYGRFQIELAHGTATFRVIRQNGANVEVDTPSVSVRPSKAGAYRIAVNEAGETEVISRQGDVEVFTPRGSQWVSAGQMMIARGSQADPEFQIVGARAMDDWDRWNVDRDRPFMQNQSSQYVDPSNSGIYGTEELDNYGSWVDVPQYGNVWRPTVGVDWAPYRSGQWVWEDWYGWTWVSYDPWGWAPYHYGRWFFDTGFGWCWYPGARGYHHYWSPALVAWFGWGGGGGFGFGFGNVGWVPLAPFETFHPWWGRGFYGRGFGHNINITNVNIVNNYRNARIGNGISGVAAGDFRSGHFGNVGRVPTDQVRNAGLVRGQMPIAPTSAHLNFTNRTAAFTPRTNENTRFFSHQQVQSAQRIPFAQQQRAMGATPDAGRTFGQQGAAANMRPSVQNQMQSSPQAARPNQNGAAGGFRRFGEPSAQQQQNRPSLENTRPNQAPNSGWQRFGTPGNSGQRFGNGGNRPESAPRYNAPANNGPANNAPRYNAPANNAPRYNAPANNAPRYNAPANNAPRYNAPANNAPRYSAPAAPRYNAPSYSAPRSAPSYSAPQRSAPSYSAPRGNSGGGGGGGGSRPSGGGGGGGHTSGGNGGHGRR